MLSRIEIQIQLVLSEKEVSAEEIYILLGVASSESRLMLCRKGLDLVVSHNVAARKMNQKAAVLTKLLWDFDFFLSAIIGSDLFDQTTICTKSGVT
jgi:hypothetical protein